MDPTLASPLLQRFSRRPRLASIDVLPGVDPLPPSPLERAPACLDVFTGFCILALIVSRDLAARFPKVGHSPWNGVCLGDLIIPFILFAVGAHMACTFQPTRSRPLSIYHILLRSAQIFALGVFLDGGFFHEVGDLTFGVSLEDLRLMGFLQRIAVALLVVGLCHVAVSKHDPSRRGGDCCSLCAVLLYHWQAAILVGIAYLSLSFFLYVPDWEVPLPLSIAPAAPLLGQATRLPVSAAIRGLLPGRLGPPSAVAVNVSSLTVTCGVSGDFSPACNAAGYIDRAVLGISHLYRLPSYRNLPECVVAWSNNQNSGGNNSAPAWCLAPFEPAGVLSTLGGVLAAFLGLHLGHVLVCCQAHGSRLAYTVPLGLVLLLGGWILQFPFSLSLAQILPWDGIPSWAQIASPGMPFNLNLFSTSLAIFASGLACLIVSAIYLLVDMGGVRFYTKLLEWSGKNWLALYSAVVAPLLGTLLAGFYWQRPENNLMDAMAWLLGQVFRDDDAALIAGVSLKVVACALFSGLLLWQRMDFSL